MLQWIKDFGDIKEGVATLNFTLNELHYITESSLGSLGFMERTLGACKQTVKGRKSSKWNDCIAVFDAICCWQKDKIARYFR